jgi:hypothetical protein
MTESIADLEDALLQAMLIEDQSIADLASACGWRTSWIARGSYKGRYHEVKRSTPGAAAKAWAAAAKFHSN